MRIGHIQCANWASTANGLVLAGFQNFDVSSARPHNFVPPLFLAGMYAIPRYVTRYLQYLGTFTLFGLTGKKLVHVGVFSSVEGKGGDFLPS